MAMRGGGEQAEGGSAGDGEDLTLHPGAGEGHGDMETGGQGGCLAIGAAALTAGRASLLASVLAGK